MSRILMGITASLALIGSASAADVTLVNLSYDPTSIPSSGPVLLAHLAERYEPLPTFVPQHQRDGVEALNQCKAADPTEFRVVAKDQRQPEERDAAAQMMEMVGPDVSGKPAQGSGQFIV